MCFVVFVILLFGGKGRKMVMGVRVVCVIEIDIRLNKKKEKGK